jgi:uncharacterized membrane protein YgdD (TMEM256/DUF423 family)
MEPQARRFCMLAALLLALATVVGALGAHALKPRLAADRYEVLQTAVLYQFFHSLGLLGLGLLSDRLRRPLLHVSAWLVFAGVVLFSGSLYLLLMGASRTIGAVTPIGGLSLIVGWCLAALALLRSRAA